MKKKAISCMLLVATVLGSTACGKTTEEKEGVPAGNAAQEEVVAEQDGAPAETVEEPVQPEKAEEELSGITEEAIAEPEAVRRCEQIDFEGYQLEQVIVLSRHNIRSPLVGGDSILGKATPHEWYAWTSAPSELSLKGGVLETQMGQYFRKWAEAEELIPANYRPEPGQVRLYANSKQRTIATAEYFSAGMFPVAGIPVEYHAAFNDVDPVFNPQLTFCTDAYAEDAVAEIFECYADTMNGLQDNYELLADVIDLEDSEGFQNGSVVALATGDEEFRIKAGTEPAVSGSLKNACSISDALVLQYYEEGDVQKAAFGKMLTTEQWESIAEIKDVYGDVLFTAPIIADNVCYPLVSEIYSEMETEGRVFTFLCGHDSNVGSVLAGLRVKDYELPDSIEKKTPIGCKVVITRWSKDGETFWSADLVYEAEDQLRCMPMLDLDNTPAAYPLQFEGAVRNADGLFGDEAFRQLFIDAMERYELLYQEYMEAMDEAA